MFRLMIIIVVSIVMQIMATTTAASEGKGNLVAFMCNKPARFLTNGVWDTDSKTDCLRRPQDILHYCRKVYPDVNVTNIMLSFDTVTIDNWCQFDGQCSSGHMKHTIHPYRCLSGEFQSDALLVPDHCFFDHIELESASSECLSYDKWNSTSRAACSKSGKIQQSFAPLRPCDVGRYAGVEFVCCPNPNKENKQSVKKELLATEMTTIQTAASSTTPKEAASDHDTAAVKDNTDQRLTDRYLRHSSLRLNEHHYYTKAKKALISHHKFKVNKMMKEWAIARQRIHDIKQSDPQRSDKLNDEITARFQKAYEALEEEGQAELEQLNVVHQQRVQVKLNERKKRAMEKYMVALTKDLPNIHQITTTLKRYISIEQKDRMHTVRRMRHMQNANQPISRDTISALRRHSATHLRILAQRIEQSIEMLTRVPEFQDEIKVSIEEYMRNFHMIDNQVQKLLSKAAADDRRFANHIDNKAHPKRKNHKALKTNKVQDHDSDTSSSSNEVHIIPSKVKKIDMSVKPEDMDNTKKHITSAATNELSDDSEIREHEHSASSSAEVHELPKLGASAVSAIRSGDVKVQQAAYSDKSEMKVMNPFIGTLGIVMFALVAMIVIVIGSILLRKRHSSDNNNSKSGGFVSVSQCSPDDRHVNKMQANGYENPTYKYFEKVPAPSAAPSTGAEPLIEKHPAAVVA